MNRRAQGAPRARRAAKIGDVAKGAGVSPATVSRVLNGIGNVSPERAERVRKVASELAYRPYGPARALRQQRTRVWAAIVADIENPFFTAMVRGVEDVAQAMGYRLVLCNSDEDLAKEASYIETAIAEHVAGVMIAVASTAQSSLDPLLERRLPVVAVDRRPVGHRVDSVVVDNRLGAQQAVDHLVSVGARRIACITGPSRVSTSTERLDGYKVALRRHGRRVDQSLIRRADFRQAGGYEATRSLLEGTGRPDALFVANNLMTLGALHAVHEAGLRIPQDIALVGFDDAPWTTLTSPQLTVVAQPTYEIGRHAAQLLSTAAAGQVPREVVLLPTLIIRASSSRRAARRV
jgi:LacI family transcriptional regulator